MSGIGLGNPPTREAFFTNDELALLSVEVSSINFCPLSDFRAEPISCNSLRTISGTATYLSINVELRLKRACWHYYRVRDAQICVARQLHFYPARWRYSA
jgi:hypothetical protein